MPKQTSVKAENTLDQSVPYAYFSVDEDNNGEDKNYVVVIKEHIIKDKTNQDPFVQEWDSRLGLFTNDFSTSASFLLNFGLDSQLSLVKRINKRIKSLR